MKKACYMFLALLSFINLANAQQYVVSTIPEATMEDSNGVALSLDNFVELSGVVHTINFSPGSLFERLQITLIDANNNGIEINMYNGYLPFTPVQGDSLTVRGKIYQSRGLTSLFLAVDFSLNVNPDHLVLNSSGNALNTPLDATNILGEDTESKFIKVSNLQYDSTVAVALGNNIHMHNNNGAYVVYIDNDTGIDITTLEQANNMYNITGVGGQVSSSDTAPFLDGYQLIPSLESDIEPQQTASTPDFDLSDYIKIFPSVTSSTLNYESTILIDHIIIWDINGRPIVHKKNVRTNGLIDVNNLSSGYYIIKFLADGKQWTTRFIKQ